MVAPEPARVRPFEPVHLASAFPERKLWRAGHRHGALPPRDARGAEPGPCPRTAGRVQQCGDTAVAIAPALGRQGDDDSGPCIRVGRPGGHVALRTPVPPPIRQA